jgi:predicted restriction endonuclease
VAPLLEFEAKTKTLPKTTEAERLVVQRVGQDVFRAALMTYWSSRCAVTGVAEPRLLRASHIKPWAKCVSDAERLDVRNGLLLAAHLDAAFDAGLISFDDAGAILFAPAFTAADRVALALSPDMKLGPLTAAHRANLAWHRTNVFDGPPAT